MKNWTLRTVEQVALMLVIAALCVTLSGCGALATADDLGHLQKAIAEKDDAIGRADRAYADGLITAQEHAAAIKVAQERPQDVVEGAKKNPSLIDQWGDFALALGTTLGVPAVFTAAGGVMLDKIRDKRRRKRGEPVDTDGDGDPDLTDPYPLDPRRSSPESPVNSQPAT